MRKAFSILGYIFSFLVLLLPLGVILTFCFGYTFELKSYPVFAVITALFSIATVVVLIIGAPDCSKLNSVLFSLSLPFSLINTLFYSLRSRSKLVLLCMIICMICCLCLAIARGKPMALKIVGFALSALMIIPILLSMFFAFIDFSKNTVVETVVSPDGTYYAQVTDSDQGALGGDTIVEVYENGYFNGLVFKIQKEPQTAYFGNWGEYHGMELYWENNEQLYIRTSSYIGVYTVE